jgi:hypothetical protein
MAHASHKLKVTLDPGEAVYAPRDAEHREAAV